MKTTKRIVALLLSLVMLFSLTCVASATEEKAAFDDVYEEFVSTLASNLNESVWENIPLVTDGSISTNSFFEIIDMTID